MTEVTKADRDAAACLLHGIKVGGGDGNTYYLSVPTPKDAAEAFARHRTTAEAAKDAKDARIAELVTHDPNNICAGIPDEAIEAGMAAWDAARADLENYVSGVTPDWDEGMIVAAIFKAVARAALQEIDNG